MPFFVFRHTPFFCVFFLRVFSALEPLKLWNPAPCFFVRSRRISSFFWGRGCVYFDVFFSALLFECRFLFFGALRFFAFFDKAVFFVRAGECGKMYFAVFLILKILCSCGVFFSLFYCAFFLVKTKIYFSVTLHKTRGLVWI